MVTTSQANDAASASTMWRKAPGRRGVAGGERNDIGVLDGIADHAAGRGLDAALSDDASVPTIRRTRSYDDRDVGVVHGFDAALSDDVSVSTRRGMRRGGVHDADVDEDGAQHDAVSAPRGGVAPKQRARR
jgi:hypothetical protein